jgi:hypothetical protein
MKKILVVLLVLAVAGGVFAQQGEWSLSGGAVIGTGINLDPVHGETVAIDGEAPVTSVIGRHYNEYDPQSASLKAAYNLEGLKAYLGFTAKTPEDKGLVGGIEYYGERFALAGEANISKLLYGGESVEVLYGWYKFLDMIKFEAAYKSAWGDYWTSNDTAGIIDAYAGGLTGYGVDFGGPWDSGVTWGRVDGHNYLLTNVELDSLQFGIKIPVLFRDDGTYNGGMYGAPTAYKLIEDSLLNSVVGLKFGLDIIEVAAQFYMKDYGVYFGGKANLGQVAAGLSFMGILGEKTIDTDEPVGVRMKFGGKVEFNTDAFGAFISAYYALQNDRLAKLAATVIGVEPGFSYNVIPTHLVFRTDVGFYFNGLKEDGTKVDLGDNSVYWGLRPQLFWNFLGTGPKGDFDGLETGITIRYTLLSGNRQNTFDAIFKWSF